MPEEKRCVGFIAEDVPELVADVTRQRLSVMDIVGVLTKVVQSQQIQLQQLIATINNEREQNPTII